MAEPGLPGSFWELGTGSWDHGPWASWVVGWFGVGKEGLALWTASGLGAIPFDPAPLRSP